MSLVQKVPKNWLFVNDTESKICLDQGSTETVSRYVPPSLVQNQHRKVKQWANFIINFFSEIEFTQYQFWLVVLYHSFVAIQQTGMQFHHGQRNSCSYINLSVSVPYHSQSPDNHLFTLLQLISSKEGYSGIDHSQLSHFLGALRLLCEDPR